MKTLAHSTSFGRINMWNDELDEEYEIGIDYVIKETVNEVIDQRIRECGKADPDPYGYHGLSIEHRMVYIENFLLTGK